MNWTTEFPTKPGWYWIRKYHFDMAYDRPFLTPQEYVIFTSGECWHEPKCDPEPEPQIMYVYDSFKVGKIGLPSDTIILDRDQIVSAEWYGPIDPPDQTNREHWLNGWHRQGDAVLLGGVHCAGCGKFVGTTCIALDDDPLPEKMPDFPFEEATCPLCAYRRMPDPPDAVDKLTERLERLKKRGPIEPPE